jgi:hypothetical protein
MSDIKNKLIKIAYENPELRDQLLPIILKEASFEVEAAEGKTWAAIALAIGLPIAGLGSMAHGVYQNIQRSKVFKNISVLTENKVSKENARKLAEALPHSKGFFLSPAQTFKTTEAELSRKYDGPVDPIDVSGAYLAAEDVHLFSTNKPGIIKVVKGNNNVYGFFDSETGEIQRAVKHFGDPEQ